MINRRIFLTSFSAFLASHVFSDPLLAQQSANGWRTPGGPFSQALGALQERAGAAGLAEQQLKSARTFQLNEDYDVLLPDLIDLIDALEDGQTRAAPTERQELDTLLGETAELLGALSSRERMALTYDPEDKAIRIAPSYEELRDGYLELFDASATLHDYMCETKNEASDFTHRLFYEALRSSGVSVTLAKIMYYAVREGGPKWDITTKLIEPRTIRDDLSEEELRKLISEVALQNPTLDEIDRKTK